MLKVLGCFTAELGPEHPDTSHQGDARGRVDMRRLKGELTVVGNEQGAIASHDGGREQPPWHRPSSAKMNGHCLYDRRAETRPRPPEQSGSLCRYLYQLSILASYWYVSGVNLITRGPATALARPVTHPVRGPAERGGARASSETFTTTPAQFTHPCSHL